MLQKSFQIHVFFFTFYLFIYFKTEKKNVQQFLQKY